MPEVFTTERLRAVPWREDHAEVAFAAYSQPDFVRYLGNSTPQPDLDYTRAWIERIAAGTGFWAVELLATGELVGAVVAKPLPGGDGEYEIGWHVFPSHQRKGYATEIGRGAARYAFDTIGLDVVYAVVQPPNAPSLGVAEKLGMTHLGRTDRYYGITTELFALNRDG